jgi:endonuclease/exonuclease/phosphatase family metal-dependent hydrolase
MGAAMKFKQALGLGLTALALFRCADKVSGPTCLGLCDNTPPVLVDFTGPADTLRFGSLNMSVGFPVSQLIALDMNNDSVAYRELTRLDSLFALGNPRERVRHMAQVAAAESLHVIGLQEVMVYRKNGMLESDFLDEFKTELEAAGGVAYTVFYQQLNDSTLTALWQGDSIAIHFAEGNALLFRSGVAVADTQRVMYQNILSIPSLGAKSERGFAYARLRGPQGADFEVYNTHLEVFDPFRPNQARELKQRILGEKLPNHAQVILGDLNASPDSSAYKILVKDASFHDPFTGTPEAQFGTCCLEGSRLWDPTAAFSSRRIDYVLGKVILGAPARKVVLDTAFWNMAGARQFASDHRLVAVTLSLPVFSP